MVNPDPYRGVFGSNAELYAKDVLDHLDYGSSGNVAGFIAETIQVGSNPALLDRILFFFSSPNTSFPYL